MTDMTPAAPMERDRKFAPDEAMNLLLSHSCSNPSTRRPGANEYAIDLHCLTAVVTAIPGKDPGTYMVIAVEDTDGNPLEPIK